MSETKKVDVDQKKELTFEEIEKTKKYSIIDGSAYNIMYGFGEQYVTPYALKLGASNFEIGLLSSIPAFIGSLFQVIGAKLAEKFHSRKKIVTLSVMMQAIMILPLFLVPLFTKSIILLTIIFSIYLICSNSAGPGWNSWIGAVVPENERADYFSRRNKITLIYLLSAVLIAGIILNYFTNTNIWIGFGILFGIAFIGRMVSWYFLSKQSEPEYSVSEDEKFSFKEFIKRLPETNFGNFVMFRSLVAFTVMIASPFFAVYMLKDLNFTYIQYTIIILVPMFIKILTATYWGGYCKKVGTRNIMLVSSIFIAFIPLGWFIAGYFFFGHPIIFFIIMLAECISGFGWAGFELSTFNYMLETVSPPKRARANAYFNIVFGTAVLAGGLIGSWLVLNLPKTYNGISLLLMVFFISAIARFSIPLIFVKRLQEVKVHTEIDEKKVFTDIVVSRPMHLVIHHTGQVISYTEKKVSNVAGKARSSLKKVAEPVRPVVKKVITRIDKGLDRIEPIRKAIEPKLVKDSKMKNYDELIKSHEHLNRRFDRKKGRKKLDRD